MIRETGSQLGFDVIGLLVLAALTITTSSAQTPALAEERAPARLVRLREVGSAALAEPPSDRADIAPASCPYHFDSDMPAATFCVYRGVVLGGGGEVCATDVVVIWSAWPAPVSVGSRQKEPDSGREVYLAFVAGPEPVVRAIVDSQRGDRAEMVEYTVGGDEAPQPLSGQMTLRTVRVGSAEVLNVDWREPRRFRPGSCTFASYSGTFLGMIRPPSETDVSADTFFGFRPESPR